MPDFISKIKSSSYKEEAKDTLQQVVKIMPAYKEFDFFVNTMREHYLDDLEKGNRNIVVVGSDIPEELVCTTGTMPYWSLGGSRISAMWADDIVPRDTDPVSRSCLGYLNAGFAEKSLILIPLINDSARKITYILKSMGLDVHAFHFPPIKNALPLRNGTVSMRLAGLLLHFI